MYYINLIFVYFPIYGAISLAIPFWTLYLTIGFVGCYLYLLYGRNKRWLNLAWFLALGYIILMSIFDEGMFWFIWYMTILLVYRFDSEGSSFKLVSYAIALVTVIGYGIHVTNDISNLLLLAFLFFSNFLMLYFGRKESQKERQKIAIMEKNRSINLLLAENERNRIGQDLHDTLGHVFALMTVKAELAQTLLETGNPQQAQKEIKELQQISKQSMQEVRTIVQSLKEHNVAEELVILDNMLQISGVCLLVSQGELANHLAQSTQGKLTMILRELATNLIKHSQAQTCQLNFSIENKQFILDYQDDGRGFSAIDDTSLHSIKDRLVTIQGTLSFVQLAQPTHLRISIPLEEK